MLKEIGAEPTETTDIQVTPSDNSVEVVWPSLANASMYELVIKDKNSNVICTLIFNADGQLTQIAFNAPARNNAPQQTQSAGFSFVVTGLDSGTSYELTMISKDSNGATLQSSTISFTTTGSTSIENTMSQQQNAKIIQNGQILILRGDKIYTLQGQEVR